MNEEKEDGSPGVAGEPEGQTCPSSLKACLPCSWSSHLHPLPNVVGIVAALVLLFIFPQRGVSTLMHQVLKLPGPGAGIAFPFGPAVIMFCMLAYVLTKKELAPLQAAVWFGVVYNLISPYVGGIRFASFLNRFIPALLLAVVLSGLVFALRERKAALRYMVPAVAGNVVFLAGYWALVFPAAKGWPKPGAVPVLLALAAAGGLALGGLVPYAIDRLRRQ